MKDTFQKLWDEYLSQECATIETEEEKKLVKKAVELHTKANNILTKEQKDAVESYTETLYDIQSSFVKKAFLKGCKYTASFLFETEMINTK